MSATSDKSKTRIKDLISEELGIPVGSIQFLGKGETTKQLSTESQEFLDALSVKIGKSFVVPEYKVKKVVKDFKRWWDNQVLKGNQ